MPPKSEERGAPGSSAGPPPPPRQFLAEPGAAELRDVAHRPACEGEPGPRPHPDCPSSKERVRSDGCRYLQKQIGGIVVDLCCRLGL